MNLEILSALPAEQTHTAPLLLVHGSWHGAWCWAEHCLEFFSSSGYAVHALSLRGHGQSEGRQRLRWSSIADYVEDLTQVISRLGAPPVLVGHSMGGFVVQKYLETHSVPAAVLVSSVPPTGALAALLRLAGRHPLAVLKTFLRLSPYQLTATPELARDMFFSASLPETDLLGYFTQIQEESFRAFLDMVLLTRIQTSRVQTPLLVLGLAGDQVFTTAEFQATARAYQTDPFIFPGIAHDFMLEEKWQIVADAILHWLAAQEPQPGSGAG